MDRAFLIKRYETLSILWIVELYSGWTWASESGLCGVPLKSVKSLYGIHPSGLPDKIDRSSYDTRLFPYLSPKAHIGAVSLEGS